MHMVVRGDAASRLPAQIVSRAPQGGLQEWTNAVKDRACGISRIGMYRQLVKRSSKRRYGLCIRHSTRYSSGRTVSTQDERSGDIRGSASSRVRRDVCTITTLQ